MKASNLLRPVLSGGTIRCICSTTDKEFRNHFEKDRALLRRFQKIDVNEPTIEDTIKILEGLRSAFEKHHSVKYTPDALKSAVELRSEEHTSELQSLMLISYAVFYLIKNNTASRIRPSMH